MVDPVTDLVVRGGKPAPSDGPAVVALWETRVPPEKPRVSLRTLSETPLDGPCNGQVTCPKASLCARSA